MIQLELQVNYNNIYIVLRFVLSTKNTGATQKYIRKWFDGHSVCMCVYVGLFFYIYPHLVYSSTVKLLCFTLLSNVFKIEIRKPKETPDTRKMLVQKAEINH